MGSCGIRPRQQTARGLGTLLALLASSAGASAASPAPIPAPIPLPSPPGQTLLLQSHQQADQGPLAQAFETQANLAYCGVASAVMGLNSLAVPAPQAPGYGPYRFWTQSNVFTPASRPWVQPERVAREGMTLQQLAGLLASQGLGLRRLHGDELTLPAFRRLLQQSLADPRDRLLVNYDRRGVGQEGGGHISPLAAYHQPSDRVLILDSARYRYPASWVTVTALWQAINTVDPASGRRRGLVQLWRPGTPPAAVPPLPGTSPPPDSSHSAERAGNQRPELQPGARDRPAG